MRRDSIIIGTAVAAILLAAGCSSTGGTPTPTTDNSGGATTALPSTSLNGAPHVADPLDVSKFRDNPCTALTPTQVQQLNIGATAKADNTGGPSCDWGSATDSAKVGVTVSFLSGGGGLSYIYANKADYAVFTGLSSIDGYPAIRADQVDQTSIGECTVVVGASDDQAVSFALSAGLSQDKSDPCTATQQLAQDVITNIKSGGS
ncbi:MAG TPA: DUF3558 domain-containing protein [Pseudonocardiaceae bacterium]|nr:DUF3558 domain-containing protein [Pseudonocardiaceae bacterium]